MKRFFVILIAFIFISLENGAQMPWDDETNSLAYKEIVELPNTTTKQLYTRAKLWMITNLVSGDNPLNYYNEEEGAIIANGKFITSYGLKGAIREDRCNYGIKYTIKVNVKEGKYKYVITDFKFKLDSWTLGNSDGIFQITDKKEYTLGLPSKSLGYIPSCNYGRLFTYNVKVTNTALINFYSEIDTEIKKKIASLSVAMKEGVTDNW